VGGGEQEPTHHPPALASAPIKKIWKIISSLPRHSPDDADADESHDTKGGDRRLTKERTVSFSDGGGVPDDEEEDLNTTPPPESLGKGWRKIQGFVKHGSFLLANPTDNKMNKNNNKNNKDLLLLLQEEPKRSQRRESLSRQHMEEIRAGIEFSTFHCILAILLYLGISVACYKLIFQTEWSVTDCLYFAVSTFTTVGFGYASI
jgi:hypothetical protein